MNKYKLLDAMEQIHISEREKEEIIMNVQKKIRGKKNGAWNWKKMAVSAAAVVLVVGVTGSQVKALVNHFVQERMESMSGEEKQAMLDTIDGLSINAFGQVRDYTESEEARKAELQEKYMAGTFPENELPQVDNEADAKKQGVCFLTTTGEFYLSADRELTDEELLEVIDFEKKMAYALKDRFIEQNAIKTQEKRDEIAAAGGVTEEEAIEIATGYLKDIFGIDGSGMEFTHYFSEADEFYDVDNYYAGWTVQGSVWYQITINANDGKPIRILYKNNEWGSESYRNKTRSREEASNFAASIKEQAADMLKNTLGIEEEFVKVESCYYVSGDETVGNTVKVYFVKEDGSVYQLDYRWEGVFSDLFQTTVEEYERQIGLQVQQYEGNLTDKGGESVTVEAVRG